MMVKVIGKMKSASISKNLTIIEGLIEKLSIFARQLDCLHFMSGIPQVHLENLLFESLSRGYRLEQCDWLA